MYYLLLTIICFVYTLDTRSDEEICHYSMFCYKDSDVSLSVSGTRPSLNQDSDTDKPITCMNVTQTPALSIFRVGFRSCPNQLKSYCNVYDGFIQPAQFKTQCEERPNVIQSYPGGQCKDSNDCLYGICVDNKCKDSDLNQICVRDENCPIGTACAEKENDKQKTCQELGDLYAYCTKSTDCKLNFVCAFNECLLMYDYNDNEDISTFKTENLDKLDVLCKSGYAVDIGTKVICASVKNVLNLKEKCTEDCQYMVNDEVMTIPDTCKCGFNYQRSKHCILGSGEDLFVDFIFFKTKLINDPEYTRYCHTVERYNEGYCVEKIKTDRSIATRQKIQDYNNMRILALDHHKLINADECIKKVVFDYDESPILPDHHQCAAFACTKTISTCLYGENPINDEGNNVIIHLNEDKCNENEVCTVKQKNGIEYIYTSKSMEGECIAKSNEALMRLPGEDCNKPEDCLNGNCNKNTNQCAGMTMNEQCKSHLDCLKGLFCDKGTCQKQRKESEPCESGWDCLNNLGCYSNPTTNKNQCMQFGLVGDIDISQMVLLWPIYPQVHIGYDTNEIGSGLMCKTGQISVLKSRCAEYSYDTNYPNMKNVNRDNLIECKAESDCYYVDNYNGKKTLKCVCGYNSKGKGYCPLPNTINKDAWLQMYALQREFTDNQCHSLSRFKCYLNPISEKINELELQTTKAHLFYKAVPCAYKVLSSTRITPISYSLAVIFFILSYL